MNPEILEKVTQYIDSLAASLGVAATHVYETMVRQMVVEGVVYSVVLTLLLIGVSVAGVRLIKLTFARRETIYRNDWEAPVFIGWTIGGLGYVILSIVVVSVVPESVMKIFNPEYFVIRDILSVVKGAA